MDKDVQFFSDRIAVLMKKQGIKRVTISSEDCGKFIDAGEFLLVHELGDGDVSFQLLTQPEVDAYIEFIKSTEGGHS